MADSQSTKTCARCKQDKSTLEFYRSNQTKDGLQVYCKPCSKIINDASLKKPKKCRRCKQPRDKNDGVHGLCSACLLDDSNGMRKCTECKKTLPLTLFTATRTKCRNCSNDINAKHYKTPRGLAASKRAYHKYKHRKKCRWCRKEFPRESFTHKWFCPACLELTVKGVRICQKCGTEIGRRELCPKCDGDKIVDEKVKHREYNRSHNQTRNNQNVNPEQRKVVAARYYQNNKHKFRARGAVHRAIERGLLADPATLLCSCGEPATQYHHHSYDKEHWLDVEPKCNKCHGEIHRLSPDTFRKRTPSASTPPNANISNFPDTKPPTSRTARD